MDIDIDYYFSVNYMNKVYSEKLLYSNTVGIDNVSNNYFRKERNSIFEKISSSIKSGTYKFSDYKIVLIPKDVDVAPRKICIATMRDRVVISILKNILYDLFSDCELNTKVGLLVEKFIETYNSDVFDAYIYADIQQFYDNISHRILISKLKSKTNNETFINLIKRVLKNEQKYKKVLKNKIGVPQGLNISNVLANIYMLSLDKKMKEDRRMLYIRYVDDIFIFTNKNKIENVKLKLEKSLQKLKLNLNDKTKIDEINSNTNIQFLGYDIINNKVSVKQGSIKKLENSLEQIFRSYYYSKDKNKQRLEWVLNLRISGLIIDDKKYGWIYYFSKINDLTLLKHLDWLVEKFKKRYKVTEINSKSFVKTYYEILYEDILNSPYLINCNSMTIDEKKDIISRISNYTLQEINSFSIEQINFVFKKNIFKSIRELERDLDGLS